MFALGVLCAPAAQADDANARDWALNGTFLATSNGDWATTNDVYRNEATRPEHLDHLDDVHQCPHVRGTGDQ